MEEHILPVIPAYRLYSRTTIVVATLLTGPLAGGYMVADNFRKLNEPKSARITWMITIIALLVIFSMAVFLVQLPNYILPIIYTVVASRLVTHFQQAAIVQHTASGGNLYSGWRGLLVSLICLVITIAPIIVAVALADLAGNQ